MASTCRLAKGSFPGPQAHECLLLAARQLAQSHHSQYDPSHDYHHVQRVVRNALVIARSINTTHQIKGEKEQRSETADSEPVDLAVIELAALFHDLLDSKYLPADQKGMTAQEQLSPFWNEYATPKTGSSAELPFTLHRRTQFPIRLAMAMTINKSQGQSLAQVGVCLEKPVFSHGQLYVALSQQRMWTVSETS
ncbi:hypothetical protein MVLG_04153 [Microbotryum lychnidis-dioicae p1A1 Lamole]|uniref:HD/PDEase domain-containing protein n=1 Tax=Microbotryum lychnidis-dioicae (strain p1A1 Lamole / MvSl-1064) TaxID=683840 RepID=U5HAC1_USTV1|nr:hypothetical protein MVLG_04153 [Microbotryum lychnidis-dioicae p1A1 Lamole]|eukprot:KDE05463.1 hypothetical protein MVLG_04153 [Microbotryum lychnidis-dioicae p1A1 Lamole]